MIRSSLMYMSCSTPADLAEKGRRVQTPGSSHPRRPQRREVVVMREPRVLCGRLQGLVGPGRAPTTLCLGAKEAKRVPPPKLSLVTGTENKPDPLAQEHSAQHATFLSREQQLDLGTPAPGTLRSRLECVHTCSAPLSWGT